MSIDRIDQPSNLPKEPTREESAKLGRLVIQASNRPAESEVAKPPNPQPESGATVDAIEAYYAELNDADSVRWPEHARAAQAARAADIARQKATDSRVYLIAATVGSPIAATAAVVAHRADTPEHNTDFVTDTLSVTSVILAASALVQFVRYRRNKKATDTAEATAQVAQTAADKAEEVYQQAARKRTLPDSPPAS